MAAALALALSSAQAIAGGLVEELRLGVFDHNVEPGGGERGIDANVEVLLAAPGFESGSAALDTFLNPRPHIGTTASLIGETSQLYAGLTWQVPLGEAYFIEASFGGAWHDGPLDVSGVASYGCAWSFRESASLGWRIPGGLILMATIEHMSNADLCDRNRGLTNGGFRLGYALD
jgi:hypothetical protein